MLPLPVANPECPRIFAIDKVSAGVLSTICIDVIDKEGCPVNILESIQYQPCPYAGDSSVSQSSSSFSSSSSSISSSSRSSSSAVTAAFSSSSSSMSSESSSSESSDPFSFSSSSASATPSESSSSFSSSSSSSSESSSSSSFSPQSSSSSSSARPGKDLPAGWTPVYRYRQTYSSDAQVAYIASVVDASKGMFSVTVPGEALKNPGVFLAELAIYDEYNRLRFTDFRYLQIENTLHSANNRPVMPSDVRMALWDYCPEVNTLIDDFEFPEEQIVYMINRPLDLWNGLTPDIHRATPTTFPWREQWLRCTVGYLLVSAARLQRRNSLAYNASGMSVNDNSNWEAYRQEGEYLISEFKEWATNKKIELNIRGGYGTLGSSY